MGSLGNLPDSVIGIRHDRSENESRKYEREEKTRSEKPQKKQKPRVEPQKVASELVNAYRKSKKDNEAVQMVFSNRQIIPVARQISEWFLKGLSWEIIGTEAMREFSDKKIVREAIALIKKLADPVLLISRLAALPSLFDSCGMCREFLRSNHITISSHNYVNCAGIMQES